MRRLLSLPVLACLAILAVSNLNARAADDAAAKQPDRAQLEKHFEETLTGSSLNGFYTETSLDAVGAENGGAPQPSNYKIEKVSKLKGDTWLFSAQISYEGHDVTLPIPLTVLWAGDTPVITLDKLNLPGLGTFTARVLFYDHQFSGVWSGGHHRGELYGRIVKSKEAGK
jgi:hypothetical protein